MDQIRFVMNLYNNETEIPEDQLEEHASKLDAKDFACRSKAKAKPQSRELAGSSPRIVPMERRNWIDIEPVKHSLSEYEVCEGEGDVVGVEAPLGGVAQVIFHGVQVVQVGVQVRVHQDRGVEEDGEGQVEAEREVE